MAGDFTAAAKAACARREVGMRKRVYQRWVDERRNGWTQNRADAEIAMMQEIADEYDAKAKDEADAIAPKLDL